MLIVIVLIVKKFPPLIALLIGTLFGGLLQLFFNQCGTFYQWRTTASTATYKGILNAITVETSIPTTNPMLNELFTAGGMVSMLGTIWDIKCHDFWWGNGCHWWFTKY